MKRHKGNSKKFPELSFGEQAKSISANLIILERQIRARMRKARELGKNERDVLSKSVAQISRLLKRLAD
ncbi:MAG: hypothetical protein ABMA26_23890 [Limisphaerales bacterium]